MLGAYAGMLFGWEAVMTFVLVSVVYAVAVGEPSFGNVGPFAVGLALFSMVFAGKAPVLTSCRYIHMLYLCVPFWLKAATGIGVKRPAWRVFAAHPCGE